ncbi:hypothetical protein AXF42_Ash002796 [Apostasia shenzhenica]|uniref:Uncharacterized protein n=1 Tax=Apostasia shenzhenica TaxID=1088818 RepID=A0A2I0A7A7_9ASPA|nr:hypothetical protein AXF42_Ash002796 [Apostasia shenzhenica]
MGNCLFLNETIGSPRKRWANLSASRFAVLKEYFRGLEITKAWIALMEGLFGGKAILDFARAGPNQSESREKKEPFRVQSPNRPFRRSDREFFFACARAPSAAVTFFAAVARASPSMLFRSRRLLSSPQPSPPSSSFAVVARDSSPSPPSYFTAVVFFFVAAAFVYDCEFCPVVR